MSVPAWRMLIHFNRFDSNNIFNFPHLISCAWPSPSIALANATATLLNPQAKRFGGERCFSPLFACNPAGSWWCMHTWFRKHEAGGVLVDLDASLSWFGFSGTTFLAHHLFSSIPPDATGVYMLPGSRFNVPCPRQYKMHIYHPKVQSGASLGFSDTGCRHPNLKRLWEKCIALSSSSGCEAFLQ